MARGEPLRGQSSQISRLTRQPFELFRYVIVRYMVIMYAQLPIGHSFVKRLKLDLEAGFDERAEMNF